MSAKEGNQKSIIFFARRFPPSVGGMENYAFQLYSSLHATGVSVHKLVWGGKNRVLLIFVVPWMTLKAIGVLFSKDVDIIHIQDVALSPIGFFLSRIFRKPFVVVAHGLDVTYDNVIYQKLAMPFLRKADKVISISSATEFQVLERGVKEELSEFIPIGANTVGRKTTKRNKPTMRILTVGRLVKRKGVLWFVESVMPKLVKQVPGLVYDVVGTGEDEPKILEAIERLDLQENIVMHGRVSDEERENIYRNASIFVMPNIPVENDMEGFGIVALEAALHSLPIVASGIEGIRDAISDGDNGYLLKARNIDDYVDRISTLINDPKFSEDFGSRARRYTIETYDWSKIAQRYLDIYDEITIV